ncbi:MAG: hypothetical protein HFF90_04910 [Oscillibacter sp.]|nr:hypothetical protein [Oscillibacter sp.]
MNEKGIQVKMLGDFSISCGGAVIDKNSHPSRKTRILLAYLLHSQGRMVPTGELTAALAGGGPEESSVPALRTALYRVRRVLEPLGEAAGKPLIVTSSGMYGWNPEAPAEVDAEAFERRCREGVPEGEDPVRYRWATLELYQGDFLPSLAAERWVEPLAEYYRGLYLAAVEGAAPVLIQNGMAREAARCCRRAVRASPYHEALYGWEMCAHAALGDPDSARAVYEELRALLYEDLGVLPGEEIQRIYREALLSGQGSVLTLENIRAELQEHSPASGALVCDYPSFRLFYQAEARAASRRGDAVHIGLLSLLGLDGRPLEGSRLSRAMDQLRREIEHSLRTGDIAACCSASQYILMLVQANYENSRLVCSRIEKAFFRTHPRAAVRIQATVFPLEPLPRA